MENKDKKHDEKQIDNSENLEELRLQEDAENLDDLSSIEEAEDEKSIEETLSEEVEKLRDEKLRLLAEMDNLRKRSERDRLDSIRYGSFNLARDILSPDDNLTRALDAVPKDEERSPSVNNLIDGLKMVQKEFSTILEKHGVKKIEALNKKFDHKYHQAMIEVESNDSQEGYVVQEMQCGYTMNDRLLRPSMVGVSKKFQENDKVTEKDTEKS